MVIPTYIHDTSTQHQLTTTHTLRTSLWLLSPSSSSTCPSNSTASTIYRLVSAFAFAVFTACVLPLAVIDVITVITVTVVNFSESISAV